MVRPMPRNREPGANPGQTRCCISLMTVSDKPLACWRREGRRQQGISQKTCRVSAR